MLTTALLHSSHSLFLPAVDSRHLEIETKINKTLLSTQEFIKLVEGGGVNLDQMWKTVFEIFQIILKSFFIICYEKDN